MGHTPGLAPPPIRAWFPTFLVIATAILSLPDNSATRVFTWPWFPLAQLVFILPLFYLLAQSLSGKRTVTINGPLAIGMIVFGIGSFFSAVHSDYRYLSIPFSAPYLFLTATYFALRSWANDGQNENRSAKVVALGRWLGMFMALVILTSFAQWLLKDLIPALKSDIPLKATFRNGHPFGHSNYTAGFATLSLSWLVALAWRSRRFERIFWAAMAVLAIALIASTGSRGGVIGLLVSLGLFGALTFWKAPLSRSARLVILFSLLIISCAVVWHEPRLRNLMLNRRWDTMASESNRQRQGMAEAGWLIGRQNPILGIGPGTIPYIYPRFRSQLSGGIEDALQVHNTYLEIWAEMGILGSVSLALSAFGFGKAAVTLIRNIQNRSLAADLIYPIAGTVGLLAYATFAFTDHQLDLIAIALPLSIYLVLVGKPPINQYNRERSTKVAIWTESAVLAFLGFSVLWFSWPNARARQLYDAALDAWYAHDQNRFLQLGHAAASTAPWDTAYLNEIAGLISEDQTTPGSNAKTFVAEEIKSCLQQSLRRDPYQEYPNFNLGWIALKEGDPRALIYFQAAAQLVPDKGGVYLGEALALLNQNRISEVPDALALEGLNEPSFLASPWWRLADFKGQQIVVRQKLDALYAKLRQDQAQLTKRLRYNQALSDWLLDDSNATPGLAAEETAQREYFATHSSPANLLSANSISYRNQRTGFPVLVRHADFPAPHDIYEVQENGLAFRELKFLFPAKGWLPTFELAALAETASAPSNHASQSK